MPFFFYRGQYTPQAWAKLVAQPQDLSEALKPSIQRFGGQVVACFIALGAEGGEPMGFIEFPDNAAAMAWYVYLQSQGLLREGEITPLLSTQEGLEALRRAGQSQTANTQGW